MMSYTHYYLGITDLFQQEADITQYKRNLLKLEIFYEMFNYESVYEQEEYTVWNISI